MAYRATPNSVIGYSPFYLLHGRELEIPINGNLKARVETGNPDVDLHIRNLKASLKKSVDRKAKARKFEVDDFVYLYNPQM
jgi:hypothetical protein